MSDLVPSIGVEELHEALGGGAVLVDVREPNEYLEVHAPDAVLIPLQTVPDQLTRFPTDRPVYVICRSGGRSTSACEWLRHNGIDAINVLGGTMAWIDAKLPVAHGPATVEDGPHNRVNETPA
jgi:rhodanese-related sulfurtransferase